MRRFLRHVRCGIVLLLVPMLLTCIRARAGQTPNVTSVIETWAGTERQVRSARFRWTERRIEAKGWKLNDSMPLQVNPKRRNDPPDDVVNLYDSELILAGEKACYTSEPKSGGERTRETLPVFQKRVFDGRVEKAYFPPNQLFGEDAYPHGELTEAKKGDRLFEVSSVTPFVWACRMGSALHKYCDPALLRFSPRAAEVNGVRTLMLEQITREQTISFWLAPEQSFAVRRHTVAQEGTVLLQRQVEYIQEGKVWIPSKWEMVAMSPAGTVRLKVTGELRSHELNGPIDDGVFDWDFPPGTWVHTDAGLQYIQRPGGAKREVTRSENKATYRQLLNSDSGMALQLPRSRTQEFALFGALALGIIGAGILCFRKRKHGAFFGGSEKGNK